MGNRKQRRQLAKLAKKGDKYIEQLAVNAVQQEIEKSANILTDDNLALSTDYTLSAMILAMDRVMDSIDQPLYECILNEFRNIYTDLITSGDPQSYLSMAEEVCGHELHIEFEHED